MKKAVFILLTSILILHFNFFGCWLSPQDFTLYFSESREGKVQDQIKKQDMSPSSGKPGLPGGPLEDSIAVDLNCEVAAVLKGAVEDKGWFFAASEKDLRNALGAYFTGPLLERLICSARDFKQKQTDWQTTLSLEEYDVSYHGGGHARATVLIADLDALTGEKQFYAMEYHLAKDGRGWRITGMLRICSY